MDYEVLDKMSLSKYYYRHLLSLLYQHKNSRRAVQQLHSHLTVLDVANVLSLWNSIIKHYSLTTCPEEAIFLFKYLKNKTNPLCFDSFTYAYLIKACANVKQPFTGNQLHSLSSKVGFDLHVHVSTALVNMYVDCRCLADAQKVFEEMPHRNTVTWNVMLTGFVKWSEIESARYLFDSMPRKNLISWTGLIDGYTRANRFDEALSLFQRMVVDEGIKPTEVTLLAIFPSIWNMGSLELCQMVHALYGEKCGFIALDIRVVNCFIDAYAKCGNVESACKLFQDTDHKKRNLISWTSIISAFAMHGMTKEASDYYKRMEDEGIRPNWITFLSVLHACSHNGFVDEGLEYYRKMVDECGIVPNIKHYGSVIDMLGRAGRLEEAEKIALSIPDDEINKNNNNVVIWRTLLGACSFHGNVEIGERVTKKIMEMEKRYGGDYVLLSNIFSAAGRFVDSERVRNVMDQRNALKIPGHTVI